MSEDVEGGGKGFLSSALLVAAVSAILLTGLLLKSDPPIESARAAAAPPVPVTSLALGSPITPEPGVPAVTLPSEDAPPAATVETAPVPVKPAAEPAPDPLVWKLATRAEVDCGRLAKARGRFTAQLLVACKAETVDRLLGAGGGSSKIYVLPARVKDDACFRVCFGAYATSKEAALAADMPKALRGKDKLGAVEIAKVLP